MLFDPCDRPFGDVNYKDRGEKKAALPGQPPSAPMTFSFNLSISLSFFLTRLCGPLQCSAEHGTETTPEVFGFNPPRFCWVLKRGI